MQTELEEIIDLTAFIFLWDWDGCIYLIIVCYYCIVCA